MTGPEVIRCERERQQMTQRNLAERVRVGTPHISKIETGRERPSAELCHSIADAIDMDAEHLAAMFGYLPDWADEILREHPHLALSALRRTTYNPAPSEDQ